jgi:tetratricopeptide (TPR) repeat protein/tRNA A-37 threonylcarbamoyl transferase component Bud32
MPSSRPEDWAEQVRANLRNVPPPSSAFRSTRYELQERLGEGATAIVYAARDRELQREVAIKVLRESVGLSDIARERFRREAQAAAGLSHPNLVTVYDAGSIEGQAYLVMERVQGKSLGELLREHPPGDRELVRLLERAARGVAAAHEKGIVHRDLKPQNILISTSGDPKVGDFGMAHLMGSRMELTRTGVPLGTPLYMAPEQVQGRAQDITPRTDVYGLGAILYEMLAGAPPHTADSIVSLYTKIAQEEPLPPSRRNPAAPRELEAVALKALDKEPARRYGSAALFADDLARYLDGKPVEARPASLAYRSWRRWKRHRWSIAAVAAALLALAAVALEGQRRTRALEEDRERERRAADERLRRAARESQEMSRRREESLRRLSNLWGRTMAILEWRQQPSRKPSEIRTELQGLLQDVSTYITDYPDLPQGYYVRARAQQFDGKLRSAEADLVRALDHHPDFSPGWALLAQVKMERYIERIYAWSPRDRANRRKEATPILREAEEALRRCEGGTPGRAASERWGLSWTRADAINETLLLGLKERYVDDNVAAAKARLEAAHATTPAAEYCEFIGNWSGEIPKVLPWLDRAIALAPNWARLYIDRANVYGAMGERKKAIEDVTRAIDIQPNLAMAHDHRGFYRIQEGDPDGGIADCGRAIELDPSLDSAFVHRAEGRRFKGDLRGAVEDCTAALALAPAMSSAWGVRGQSRLGLREWDAAIADLSRAIDLAPEEPLYYVQRAAAFRGKKDFARVIQDCDRALQLSPSDWVPRIDAVRMKAEAKRSP